ncbi:LLM class F420-dependent oxidoreductase [Acidiferrimicrobium sp. IK]|uniref:LLM class F420-dependent oxidoreductase n=1 Tax=Acidiferrimicrobium sp. IK TaxID=2871700 RepID=UPI0021CB611E
MRYIYQYPDAHGTDTDLLDSGPVAELAVIAEGSGWAGFSFTEHPAPGARWLENGGHQTLDPLVALGHVAAVTSRIRLLTYLAVLPYRNPFLLAKAAATVDKLSGGRLTLGAGTGYLKGEYAALGVDFEERNALFDEALDVLPLHWAGDPFSYEGRHFSARGIIARPRPVQDPIPIWIGGNSRLTLRRVAARAQGWMPLLGPDELFTTARTANLSSIEEIGSKIKELRDMAGERGDALDVALPYTDTTIASPGTDVERHKDSLGRLADIGVTWVVVSGPVGSPARSREFLESFGANYA